MFFNKWVDKKTDTDLFSNTILQQKEWGLTEEMMNSRIEAGNIQGKGGHLPKSQKLLKQTNKSTTIGIC